MDAELASRLGYVAPAAGENPFDVLPLGHRERRRLDGRGHVRSLPTREGREDLVGDDVRADPRLESTTLDLGAGTFGGESSPDQHPDGLVRR